MKVRRKKQTPVQRTPHINRQKQSAFHYSSNRSQTDRVLARQDIGDVGKPDKKTIFTSKLKRLPYLFGGLAIIILIGFFSLLTDQPKTVIKSGQAPLRNSTEYDQAAINLTGSLQSRSKLTINRQKITEELKNQFPELHSATVATPLFARSAVIELEMAQPKLLLNNGSDTFIVDASGVVLLNITKKPLPDASKGLLMLTDQSNTLIEEGKPALTAAQVRFMSELRHQSEAKKMTIESLNLIAGGGELVARYKEVPYFIKYNLNEDARKSFGTFYAAKEYSESSKLKPAEYIDVRIPERAYVK